MSTYTIHKLAKLAGVSVRTLHHYDHIGILQPVRNSTNGYRIYNESSVVRLQQILFFKELDFTLEEIHRILESPEYDRVQALEEQKRLIMLKKDRLEGLVQTIDTMISRLKGGEPMDTNTIFDSLSDEQIEDYKKEAKARWGSTDMYKKSVERSHNWSKEDIKRVQREWTVLLTAVADTMDEGIRSDATQKAIDDIYKHLHTFYEPNLDMFEGLGKMYVDDDRFRKTFEKIKSGLAEYVRDAVVYYVEARRK